MSRLMLFLIIIFEFSREGKDHITDSYFCMINQKGTNRKNRHHVQYFDVSSAVRAIPHGTDLPVPASNDNTEYSSDSEHSDIIVIAGDDAHKPEKDDSPGPLTPTKFNDQTRDLNLSKAAAQMLISRLKFRLVSRL